MDFNKHEVYFSTFTIEGWTPIFEDFPGCKILICDSLGFLFLKKKINVFGFVIMIDHIHLLWECLDVGGFNTVTTSFKKYTGKQIKEYLQENEPLYLSNFVSERKDRVHKLWKLKTSSTRILHPQIYNQKLNYIHLNPTRGKYKMAELPEEYKYSSAQSYFVNKSFFQFLTVLKVG
ncbi:MAG: hypothetical protein HKN68_03740 [Saprospiraceae bacterium]|nr:hypothetical protein [Saprospiraceae bacterium]